MTVSRYCRIAVFDHMIVVLDLKRPRYFLYDEACTKAFSSYYIDLQEVDRPSILAPLISDGIITSEPSRPSLSGRELIADYRAMCFETFDSGAWGSRTLGKRSISRFEMPLLFRIIRSVIMLKIFGFGALSALERLRPCPAGTAVPSGIDPAQTVERYLSASMWSPFRITCLPLSFSLVTHFRRNNIPAQLVIGVRPTPFVAHAWVEIDKYVYGDDQDLRKSYGEIYRTPRHDNTRRSGMAA